MAKLLRPSTSLLPLLGLLSAIWAPLACVEEQDEDPSSHLSVQAATSPLVFQLLVADTGRILDGDISDGVAPLSNADLSLPLTISGFVQSGPALADPVDLKLNGPAGFLRTRREGVSPYALFGDRSGDFDGEVLPKGAYTFEATSGSTRYDASFSLTVKSTPPPTPPPSSATSVPGVIDVRDFDAFNDTTPQNEGNCGPGPVDMNPFGSGCLIGWTRAGEWVEYELSSAGGTFDLEVSLASNHSNRQIALSLDGQALGQLTAPSQGWTAPTTQQIGGISMPAGTRTLRVTFLTGGTNLTGLKVTSSSTPPPPSGGGCVVVGDKLPWHRVELRCQGPFAKESDNSTFTDYRMDVTFTKGATSLVVPGHFAADGQAKDTSADQGSTWRAYFMPPEPGSWSYSVSMRQGKEIATTQDPGQPVAALDRSSGTFSVSTTTRQGQDMRLRGLLTKAKDERYLRFAGTGLPFVKGGVDSPENIFGYGQFDNTYKVLPGDPEGVSSCKGILHKFAPHLQDWSAATDPSWGGSAKRGKELIGMINYLASTGVNAIYMLPMSVNGDGCDAHPWRQYSGNRRSFDVSKLDQWEVALGHMTSKGMLIHYVTQETENDALLNQGNLGLERRLYYRELISRFAHHPALQWNLGEETKRTAAQIKAYADYIKALDPYNHPLVLHTYTQTQARKIYDQLLGHGTFDGPTLQYSNIPQNADQNAGPTQGVYGEIAHWLALSKAQGHQWYVTATEASGSQAPQPVSGGPAPVTSHQRVYWMWASVMSGGAGFEWYLKNGAGGSHAYDLAIENQREFDTHWRQSGHLVRFWNVVLPQAGVELQALDIANNLTSSSTDWVLADPGQAYVIYLREGGSTNLTLTGSGTYKVKWFNPRTGQITSRPDVSAGGTRNLGAPPSETTQDWAVVVHR